MDVAWFIFDLGNTVIKLAYERLQMFSNTRSYASLITVLPRSKTNHVIILKGCCWLLVAGC
jgi:hypothetical protein